MANSARRGIIFLLTGTVAAQALNLIALPIISRLYSPAEYGFFSIAVAMAGVIAPVATLRLETAVMLPDRAEETRALTFLGLFAIIGTSILCGIVLQVLTVTGSFGLHSYPAVSVWVALLVLLTASFTFLGQLALRERRYGLVARRSFIQSLVTVVVQGAFGFMGKTSLGLLVGATLGRLSGILSVLRVVKEYMKPPGQAEILRALKTHWRFPLVFTPSALLNSMGMHAPLLYFTALFGASLGGQLGMAERIMAVPIAVIGSAVAQAIDAEVSRLLRTSSGNFTRIYLRFSLFLGLIGLVILLAGGFLGGMVVPTILGDQWELAGEIVQVLSVTSAARLVATPLARFIVLLQKSLANTVLDVFRVMLVAASMVWCSYFSYSFLTSIWVIYSVLTITYLVTWIYGLWLVKSQSGRSGTIGSTV